MFCLERKGERKKVYIIENLLERGKEEGRGGVGGWGRGERGNAWILVDVNDKFYLV